MLIEHVVAVYPAARGDEHRGLGRELPLHFPDQLVSRHPGPVEIEPDRANTQRGSTPYRSMNRAESPPRRRRRDLLRRSGAPLRVPYRWNPRRSGTRLSWWLGGYRSSRGRHRRATRGRDERQPRVRRPGEIPPSRGSRGGAVQADLGSSAGSCLSGFRVTQHPAAQRSARDHVASPRLAPVHPLR